MCLKYKTYTMSRKILVFDFDGPIVDSLDAAYAVARKISPELSLENYKARFLQNIFVATDAAPELKDETISFDAEYAIHMKALDLHPGKKDALALLAEQYDFHIISGAKSDTICEYLKRHQVDHFFFDVLGGDVEKSKVKRFKMLCDKYSIKPEDIVFVTDTVGDLHEAFEVGIGTTIAVCDGFQAKELLEAQNPTFIVDSIMNIPQLLLN